MLFPSFPFLSLFLPIITGLCVLTRRRLRVQEVLLCAASLLFYAWGSAAQLPVLLLSIGASFLFGHVASKHPRLGVVLAAAVELGLLFAYKYTAFAVSSVNALLGTAWPVPDLPLPLGLSFFTFQGLSYVIDVGRREHPASSDPVGLTLYIAFFPQLIAGPIVRYADFAPQLRARRMTSAHLWAGLTRFIGGLARKVLLADTLASLADAAFACPDGERGALLALMGAAAYTLQLYLDFSGYSAMAVGLGEMLGFRLPENFDRPLCAVSLRDFWRRWHQTLSGWFRSYVYLPLGGSRAGRWRTVRNLAVVFLLTGLWHGAAWTFVLWGAWNGLLVIAEHLGLLRPEKWPRPLARGYTLAAVVLGFVLFRAESLGAAVGYWVSLTDWHIAGAAWSRLCFAVPPTVLLALFLGAACAAELPARLAARWRRTPLGRVLPALAAALLLAASYASILSGSYHPFLYFRF